VPTTHPGRLSLCERVPVGLVGVITPWNFPLVLGMRVIAPALALGNAVLIKPSPETPLSGGLAIAELFAEAGHRHRGRRGQSPPRMTRARPRLASGRRARSHSWTLAPNAKTTLGPPGSLRVTPALGANASLELAALDPA
jgi:hypothetical protein